MTASKTMIVAEILALDRGTIPIFFQHGLHCLGCVMAHGETLEEACQAHGIDCDALLQDLNAYLARQSEGDQTAPSEDSEPDATRA